MRRALVSPLLLSAGGTALNLAGDCCSDWVTQQREEGDSLAGAVKKGAAMLKDGHTAGRLWG